MSELASPDGVLSKHPETGGLALSWPVTVLGEDSVERLEGAYSNGPHDEEFLAKTGRIVIARSSTAIVAAMGLLQGEGFTRVDDGRLHTPVLQTADNPIGEKVVGRTEELLEQTDAGQPLELKGQQLPAGRWLQLGDLVQVEGDEIQYAIDEKQIGIAAPEHLTGESPYRIEDDVLYMPILLRRIKAHPRRFLRNDRWLDLMLHGRRFATPNMVAEVKKPEDAFDHHSVVTVLASTGSFYGKIADTVSTDGLLTHVSGANWLDPSRTMGLSPELGDKRRGHQVELVNQSPGTSETYGSLKVPITLYKPNPMTKAGAHALLNPAMDWNRMDKEEREELHENGFNLGEVIEPVVKPLVQVIQETNCAVVATPKGITEVPDDGNAEFNAINIHDAVLSSGERRTVPDDLEHLTPFLDKLGLVGNNPRVVIARDLPPRYIPEIMNRGDLEALVIQQDGEIVTTKDEHSAMVNLVRQGKIIAWVHNNFYKVLHRSGFRATPKDAKRIGDLHWVIAGYGSHVEKVGEEVKPSIYNFVEGMIASGFDPHHLGFAHGNGPGIMRAFHEAATHFGALSAGVGMDFGALGQPRHHLQWPRAEILFHRRDRLPRQGILGDTSDISTIGPGAIGSISEELGILLCTTKLFGKLAAPALLIEGDGLYDHTKQQHVVLAGRNYIQEGDTRVELKDLHLAPPWVANTIECVPSYKAALEICLEYMRNPAAWWEDRNIPQEAIKKAAPNQEQLYKEIGRTMAPALVEAVDNY